jgi:ferritin-like protein
MSSGYNEADLSVPARDLHRALASLQEELEAVDYYHQRADRTDDSGLKAVLLHNRNEEIEHAVMLLESIRRVVPEFDTQLKTYLFSTQPITTIEAGTAASEAGGGGDLGLRNLK